VWYVLHRTVAEKHASTRSYNVKCKRTEAHERVRFSCNVVWISVPVGNMDLIMIVDQFSPTLDFVAVQCSCPIAFYCVAIGISER
jgi:hypothetical protein